MFKIESKRIKREFKINDGKLYASQILNTYSGMSFVPDGNGCEFVIHFTDGEEYSSKGLGVIDAKENDGRLCFVFEENMGISVELEYWVHKDNNTICKRLVLNQFDDREIDYIELESIGIINSKTHFSVPELEENQFNAFEASLGQPIYIDSLFFGCEFPATDNKIIHGTGKVCYYVGSSVGEGFKCPVTVMGASKDNTIAELKKAFFEYIEFISQPTDLRLQYNSWYDHMRNINEKIIIDSFKQMNKELKKHNAPELSAYVVDDGWNDTKSKFWSFNKNFPDGMTNISELCKGFGSGLGMWLGPRGGYFAEWRIAKRWEKSGTAYFNRQGMEICVGSDKYIKGLEAFLIDTTRKYDINYWKIDGFARQCCKNPKHDHKVGGRDDMYFITDMWQKWIRLYKHLRNAKPDIWINMTCYANVSPWWLQWVNSIWIQNSNDIGFAENQEEQSQSDAEMTYRDSRYYDALCTRAYQIPLNHLYNHEPIYGHEAKVKYSDEEFEKNVFWCTVRGQALNELHLSYDMMNEAKWDSLARAMSFQKENYHILRNSQFIGGNPEENNVYGYISWTPEGEGIIAMRNPTNENRSLTLTFNKLMGTPEGLCDASRQNIYCKSIGEGNDRYSYNSKMNLTLHPYEIMIFKIG